MLVKMWKEGSPYLVLVDVNLVQPVWTSGLRSLQNLKVEGRVTIWLHPTPGSVLQGFDINIPHI